MVITEAYVQKDGNFIVNGRFGVPDDMANRHRRKLQAWIDAGNTPDPFVGPSALELWQRTMDSSDATLPRWGEDLYDAMPQAQRDGATAQLKTLVTAKKASRLTKP
jgi:hypothetical protein